MCTPGPVPTQVQPPGRGRQPPLYSPQPQEGLEDQMSKFRRAWDRRPPERWVGRQHAHRPARSKKSEGWLWGCRWGAPCADTAVSWPPVFLLTSRRGLQSTTPSSRGSLAAPQHPPGSCAPPAHAESKQAQENTTHVKAIDAGKRRPRVWGPDPGPPGWERQPSNV